MSPNQVLAILDEVQVITGYFKLYRKANAREILVAALDLEATKRQLREECNRMIVFYEGKARFNLIWSPDTKTLHFSS